MPKGRPECRVPLFVAPRSAVQEAGTVAGTSLTSFRKAEKGQVWLLGSAPKAVGQPQNILVADIYTIAVNLAGIPALSVPCGFTAAGLPVGMQLMGDYFADDLLLNVAHRYQQETQWHHAHPAVHAREA